MGSDLADEMTAVVLRTYQAFLHLTEETIAHLRNAGIEVAERVELTGSLPCTVLRGADGLAHAVIRTIVKAEGTGSSITIEASRFQPPRNMEEVIASEERR